MNESDRTRAYVQAWIRKAESDVNNARLILASQEEAPPLDTVCFHCQQAAEKYLKAFLVDRDVSFLHSHNLSDLVVACAEADGAFAAVRTKAETLTPYAVEIRYPDDFYMPMRHEAEEAYEIALEIKQLVLVRLSVASDNTPSTHTTEPPR